MKLRKLGSMALAAFMAVSLVACSSSGTASSAAGDSAANSESAAADSTGKKRVCFVARASADTFAAWLMDEMKKESEKYPEIELTCVSGEGDDNKENGLLEDCITKEYDLVIVQSNNNAAQAPYVKKLLDAGIPVITTNPTTHQSDLDGSDNQDVMEGTGTVDADPIEQAKVSAQRAVKEVPQNANVVILNGPSGNFHADKRREAWTEYFLSKRPDVKVLYEDYANWNSDEALTLMEAWVQAGTHIDAIISMNDYIGDDGKAKFLAYGVDGTAQGCLLIKEGLLTSTALQSAADLAKKNMEYASKVVKGELKVTEVNDHVEAPQINAENVNEYLKIYVENGEISESDIK